MLISNSVSQPYQQNFKGALLYEGMNTFDQKKLKLIAEIFEQKTQGLPDATLRGELKNIGASKPVRHTIFRIYDKDFASLQTLKFRTMFNRNTPEKIANKLAKFARAAHKENKKEMALEEIKRLENTKNILLAQAQEHKTKNGREKLIESCETRAKRLEKKIERQREKYNKMKTPQKPIFGLAQWSYQ